MAITKIICLLTFGVSVLSPPMKQNNESFPSELNTWKVERNPMSLLYTLAQWTLHCAKTLITNTSEWKVLAFLLNIIKKEKSSFYKNWGKQCLWLQDWETCWGTISNPENDVKSRVTQTLVFSSSRPGQAIIPSLKQRCVKTEAPWPAIRFKFKLKHFFFYLIFSLLSCFLISFSHCFE